MTPPHARKVAGRAKIPSGHPTKTPAVRAMLNRPPLSVSESSLFRRVDRHLRRHYGAAIRKARPSEVAKFGVYVGVDAQTGRVLQRHVDLVALARELGCLSPRERIEGA